MKLLQAILAFGIIPAFIGIASALIANTVDDKTLVAAAITGLSSIGILFSSMIVAGLKD